MDFTPVTIVLIEDVSTVQFFIRKALTSLSHAYTLLIAGSLADARIAMDGKLVDLFIIDIVLPDGNGIDFLSEIANGQPHAKAIVVTASPSEEHRIRAERLGVIKFLGKPFDRDRLCGAISELLGWDSRAANKTTDVRLTLSGLTTVDIMQMKCISGATCVVEFSDGAQRGRIYFDRGNIIHLSLLAEDGTQKSGVEALEEIASWRRGCVKEVKNPTPCPNTTKHDLKSLIFDAEQSLGESRCKAA